MRRFCLFLKRVLILHLLVLPATVLAQDNDFSVKIDDHGVIQIREVVPSASFTESFIRLQRPVGAMAAWQFGAERLTHILLHLPQPPQAIDIAELDSFVRSSQFPYKGLLPAFTRKVLAEGHFSQDVTSNPSYLEVLDFLNRFQIEQRALVARVGFDARVVRSLDNWLAGFKSVFQQQRDYFAQKYPQLERTGAFAAVQELTTQNLIEVAVADGDLYYSDQLRRAFDELVGSGWLTESAFSGGPSSSGKRLNELSLAKEFPGMSNAVSFGEAMFTRSNFAAVTGGGHLPSRHGDQLTNKFQGQFVELQTQSANGGERRALLYYYGGTPGAAPYQLTEGHGVALTANPIDVGARFLAEVDGEHYKDHNGRWRNFSYISYSVPRPGGATQAFVRNTSDFGTEVARVRDPNTGKRYAFLLRLQESVARAQNGLILRVIHGLNQNGAAYERVVRSGDLPYWGEAGWYAIREGGATHRYAYGASNQGRQDVMAEQSATFGFRVPSPQTIANGSHDAPACFREAFSVSNNASFDHYSPSCDTASRAMPAYLNPLSGEAGKTNRQVVISSKAASLVARNKRISFEELVDLATDTYSPRMYRAVQVSTALFDVWGPQSLSSSEYRAAHSVIDLLRGYDGRTRDDVQTLAAALIYDKIRSHFISSGATLHPMIRAYIENVAIAPENLMPHLRPRDARVLGRMLAELVDEFYRNCYLSGKLTWGDASEIVHHGVRTGPSMIGEDAQLGGTLARDPDNCRYSLVSHSPFYIIGTPEKALINTLGSQLSVDNEFYSTTLVSWSEKWNRLNADNSGRGGSAGFHEVTMTPQGVQAPRNFVYDQTLSFH